MVRDARTVGMEVGNTMEAENKRIIEINGLKCEIDLRNVKKIDEFKVGDNVKVLRKTYGSNYDVLPGVIIEFVYFQALPTIQIAVFKRGYGADCLEFICFNSQSKDIEIAPCSEHELKLEKSAVIDKFNSEIVKKEEEIKDLTARRDWLVKYFEKYFSQEGHEK